MVLMSDAPTAAAAPTHPDPDRAVSARLDPAGAGNILRLLRTLIAYGRNLVETLRQERDPTDIPWHAFLTSIFGTTTPALITVTIIRGLLRLAALQARLTGSLARASLLPLPLLDDRAEKRIDGGRRPGRRQPRAAEWSIPPGWPAAGTSLDRLPTPEEEMFGEIVEQDRDRPIDPILVDICLDLGIVPALTDPAIWDELRQAITLYGGDPVRLLARAVDSADITAGQKTPDLIRRHSATGAAGPNDGHRLSPMAGAILAIPSSRLHGPTLSRPPDS